MAKKHKDEYADQYDHPPPLEHEEVPPEERAKDLLKSMTEAARHNAPVTPLMLSELAHLLAHLTGQPITKPLHRVLDARGHPGNISFKKPDGTVEVVDTAEEALVYVRSLPVEVQARPHWRAADKKLEESLALTEGGDTSPAIRAFENAVAQDAAAEPRPIDIPPRDASLDPPKPEPAPEQEPAHA